MKPRPLIGDTNRGPDWDRAPSDTDELSPVRPVRMRRVLAVAVIIAVCLAVWIALVLT